MKVDWSFIFYLVSAVCAMISLATDDVGILALGLICAVIAIFIERKDRAYPPS